MSGSITWVERNGLSEFDFRLGRVPIVVGGNLGKGCVRLAQAVIQLESLLDGSSGLGKNFPGAAPAR
jgi:hypothetical protein